jgi:hypothetical protein
VRLPKPEKRAKVKKAPPRKSKRPRRKLLAYADSLWSQIIRRPGACVICGKTERLQAAHGFSRRYHATRHDLRNGFCLCSGCHIRYTYDPLGWDTWLQARWGELLYTTLRERALLNLRVDLELTIKALEAVLHSGAGVPNAK